MNTYYTEDREIGFGTVFLKALLHWKLILLVACIFAVLGYGYAKYKQQTQKDSSKTEAVLEEEQISYDMDKENVYETIHRYETALSNERKYRDNSLLMQLDPYHVVSTTQEFEVRAIGNVDINELAMVGRRLTNFALSSEILSQIAEQYDTEPQYIRELVSAGARDNQYELGGAQTNAGTGTSETAEFVTEEKEENYYFYVTVKAKDESFSQDVIDQIAEYIQQKSAEITQVRFTFTPLPAITYEAVDNNVISGQNDSRSRAFDYSDKLVKSNTAIDNLENVRSGGKEEDTQKKISGKKYAAAGFIGGAFLMFLLLILQSVLTRKFQTEEDFKSWFALNYLGTAPVERKKKLRGVTKKIADRLDGYAAQETPDDFYNMAGINMANVSTGSSQVLVTGTADKLDMFTLEEKLAPILREKCADTTFKFAEDIVRNPETRSCLQETDGVILVEKRNKTNVDDVKKEIEIVSALNKKILGAVLL